MSTVEAVPEPMSVPKSLLMLAGLIVVIGGYIVLAAVLGISSAYLGFLFLLYWTGFDHMKMERWAPDAFGMFFGLGLAFLLHYMMAQFGVATGGLSFTAIMIVVTFMMIRGILPIVVNLAAMLLLTITTAPPFSEHADYRELFIGLAFGVAYFSIVILGFLYFSKLFANKPA